LPFAQDIHSIVFEPFHLQNLRCNANTVDRVLAFLLRSRAKQDETEGFILFDASVDHQLVPFFKNVKGNDDVWE